MSHRRDLVKRRDSTQRSPMTSAGPNVMTCALPWVRDRPEYRLSSAVYLVIRGASAIAWQRRWCVMTMPLGSPVVPEVKMIWIALVVVDLDSRCAACAGSTADQSSTPGQSAG